MAVPLDWSPDGRSLAIAATGARGSSELMRIDLGSGALSSLAAARNISRAKFSPDGRVLAFDRQRGTSTSNDVVALSLADRREQVIVSTGGLNAPAGWTLDGHLLFISTRRQASSLWLQPLSGLAPQGPPTLLRGDISGRPLGVTVGGDLVGVSDESHLALQIADVDLSTGTVPAATIRTLDAFVGFRPQMAWSPDGRTLAYVSRRDRFSRQPVLVLRSLDGDEIREVDTTLANIMFPAWSPDLRTLYVHGVDAQERQGLFRIDVASGRADAIKLAQAGEFLAMPQPTPDGARLLYIGRAAAGDMAIIERQLESGAERVVLAGVTDGSFRLSPDGAAVAVSREDRAANRRSVVVVELATGASRIVHAREFPGLLSATEWTRDGRFLRLHIITPGEVPYIALVPASGGTPVRLGVPSGVTNVRFAPDGKRLVFVQAESASAAWVIRDVVPQPKAARK